VTGNPQAGVDGAYLASLDPEPRAVFERTGATVEPRSARFDALEIEGRT
jgi:hypothetical protein